MTQVKRRHRELVLEYHPDKCATCLCDVPCAAHAPVGEDWAVTLSFSLSLFVCVSVSVCVCVCVSVCVYE